VRERTSSKRRENGKRGKEWGETKRVQSRSGEGSGWVDATERQFEVAHKHCFMPGKRKETESLTIELLRDLNGRNGSVQRNTLLQKKSRKEKYLKSEKVQQFGREEKGVALHGEQRGGGN